MKIITTYFFVVLLFFGENAFAQTCNLVQNGSFEVYSTCPIGNGEINKATGWHQGVNSGFSSGSSDFFHQTCGFMNVGGGITPLVPFPNGVGCAGVYINYGAPAPYYKEEVAQFLNFCAGQKYKLEIYLAKPSSGSYVVMQNNFSLQIGNAAVLPTAATPTTLCAVNFNEVTNVTGTLITSSWQKFTRTFTATQNANAFLFSGSCAGPFTATAYVFFDDVVISTVDTLSVSPNVISTCDSASFTITIPGGCYGPYDVVINDGTTPDTLFNINTGYVHTVFPVGNTTYTVTSIINNLGCATPLAIPVVVNSGAINNIVNASICSGASYTLPGGGVVSVSGTYKDTLISAGGCDSIITTQLSVVLPFSATQTLTVCQGDSVQLPGGSYALVPGNYLDSLLTIGGCDSVIATILLPGNAVTSSQNVSICNGNNYVLPGGQSVSVPGTYIDTVLSVGGCDSIITTNLTINNTSAGVQNPSVCSGSTFVLPGGTVVSVAGTYTDTLVAANGCDSIVTTNLTVNASPVVSVSANVTVTSGNSATLSASGGGTYLWSPSTGLNTASGATVICTPENSQLYCVTVTDASGCTDTACVNVTLDIQCGEIYLPNAFSPNGDDENDIYFAYIHPSCVKEFKLIIYNRFGEKLFETGEVTLGWDGKFRGIMSNPAVYAYYCKAVLINGTEVLKEGNISLVR